MAISYPLSLPASTGMRSVSIRAANAVSLSESPYTYASQALHWGGQRWLADFTLQPMKREIAEQWAAWLISLNGRYGTFLIGDKLHSSIRGTATTVSVSGSAGDNSVTVVSDGTLLAGDMIQFGSGADARLHKVLVDLDGDGTLEIWPGLRKNRSNAPVTLTNAMGVFRLTSNETDYDVNNLEIYGISFSAMEAI